MSFCLIYIQDISKKGIQSQYIFGCVRKRKKKEKVFCYLLPSDVFIWQQISK